MTLAEPPSWGLGWDTDHCTEKNENPGSKTLPRRLRNETGQPEERLLMRRTTTKHHGRPHSLEPDHTAKMSLEYKSGSAGESTATEGGQDLAHRDDVQQVVMEDRDQPVGVPVADEVVVEPRDLLPRHVPHPAAAADAVFEGLEATVRQGAAPAAAGRVQQVEVPGRHADSHAMDVGPVAQERHIVGLAVEG